MCELRQHREETWNYESIPDHEIKNQGAVTGTWQKHWVSWVAWDVAAASGEGPSWQIETNPEGQVPIIYKSLLSSEQRTSGSLSNIRSDSEHEGHTQKKWTSGPVLRGKTHTEKWSMGQNHLKCLWDLRAVESRGVQKLYLLCVGLWELHRQDNLSADLGSGHRDISKYGTQGAAKCSQKQTTS